MSYKDAIFTTSIRNLNVKLLRSLPPSLQLIYLQLKIEANNNNCCYISDFQLAIACKYSEKKVTRVINELISMSILEKVPVIYGDPKAITDFYQILV